MTTASPQMPPATSADPLAAYWMPFTANRAFKRAPRLVVDAEGVHYRTADGRRVLDAIAGLWCVNAGHRAPRVVEAIQRHAEQGLDYASSFQLGHPAAFDLAERLARWLPDPLNHVFFTGSGSESVETALKIALAYHRRRGEGQRQRLIGRERAFHGMSLAGLAVGGIPADRRPFGNLLAGVDHLRHTHHLGHQAFSRGQPRWGAHRADELERLLQLHGPETVAAVIVEPVAGAGGVLIPPVDYLQRLRTICDRHGVLLIFDEVITGFGRLAAPFATLRFEVTPDLVCLAKGITNGAVPFGAVVAADHVHDAFMQGDESAIELPHGYTYSGHPLGCAAALATLDTYEHDGVFEQAVAIEPAFEAGLHSLRDASGVIDIRNLGVVGAVEFEPWPGRPGSRAKAIADDCWQQGVLLRPIGESVVMSPPLVLTESHLQQIVDAIRTAAGRVLDSKVEPS